MTYRAWIAGAVIFASCFAFAVVARAQQKAPVEFLADDTAPVEIVAGDDIQVVIAEDVQAQQAEAAAQAVRNDDGGDAKEKAADARDEPPVNPPEPILRDEAPVNPPEPRIEAAPAEQAKPEEPAYSPQELADLIEQLGADEYETRLSAEQELGQAGLLARDELLKGLKSKTPHIRRSCRRILGDVLEADFQQRLKKFLDDPSGGADHDLPAWAIYRELIGSDKASRELYVRMLREELGLLASSEAGEGPAADALRLRFQQIYRPMYHRDPRKRKQPTLESIAALVFVSSQPDLDLPDELIANPYWSNIVQQSEFRNALQSGSVKEPTRRLLGLWINQPTTINLLSQKIRLAVQYELKQGYQLALRAAHQKNGVSPSLRVYAVMGLGKLGGKEKTGTLVDLLKHDDVCSRRTIVRNGERSIVSIQIRDVALAWLIHLTDQKHADYGMPNAKADFDRVERTPTYMGNYGSMGFSDEEERDKALEKWEKWYADNKDKIKPLDAKDRALLTKPSPIRPNVQNAFNPLQPLQQNDDDEELEGPGGLELADRLQTRDFLRAKDMIKDGRYAEATQILGEILALESDYSFKPDRDAPLYRRFKPEAERLLEELPEEGQNAYRLQFEPLAQRDLDEALEAGDLDGVAAVAHHFFQTKAGGEAAYLTGAHLRTSGQPFLAAIYFDRLRRRCRDADRFEPGLSLQLASSLMSAGLVAQAEVALGRLQTERKEDRAQIAGELARLLDADDDALAWFGQLLGIEDIQRETGDWTTAGGGPTRNEIVEPGSPFLRGQTLGVLEDKADLRSLVKKAKDERRKKRRLAVPAVQPLVVGDLLLARTPTHTEAIDLTTGEVVWRAPLDDALRHYVRLKDKKQRESLREEIEDGLERRLWKDETFGQLSADKSRLWAVEALPFSDGNEQQRLVVMPDGRRGLDTGVLRSHNLLSAYQLKNGKLDWEIGGPASGKALRNAGAWFLSSPLPLGDRLYVAAEFGSQTRLLELSAATGDTRWELSIAEREPRSSRNVSSRYMPSSDRRKTAAPPAADDGVIVCHTADDEFVAVDLAKRDVLWIYHPGAGMLDSYRRLAINPWQFGGNLPNPEDMDDSRSWLAPCVMISQGRALLAPAEADRLYCLNLRDGALQWSAPRRDGVYVGGVDGETVVVVGRGGMWGLSLETGKPIWQHKAEFPPGAEPSGKGYLVAGAYFTPLTSGEVLAVDLQSGRIASRSRAAGGEAPGNLVRRGDSVYSQTVDSLTRFPLLSERLEELKILLQKRPEDAELLADQAEVLLYGGQVDKAMEAIRRGAAVSPGSRLQQLLTEALIDGLEFEPERHLEAAAEHDLAGMSADRRLEFLRSLAKAYQRSGRLRQAFAAHVQLIESLSNRTEIEHLTPTRAVRRDVWPQARLVEIYKQGGPEDRAEMDRLLAEKLAELKAEEFLSRFGATPAGDAVRIELAAELENKNQLRAESLLRTVATSGNPQQRAEATARLARMMHRRKNYEAAASAFEYLASEYENTVCLDGKTGAELFAALPGDDPVRDFLERDSAWPYGKVEVDGKKGSNSVTYRYPVLLRVAGVPSRRLSLEIDSQGSNLYAYKPNGAEAWKVNLPSPQTTWRYGGALYSYSQAVLDGGLLVLWTGNRVCALDVSDNNPKLVWSHDTITVQPQYEGAFGGFAMRMRIPKNWAGLAGSEASSLVVGSGRVIFQQDDRLLMVDAVTGKELWRSGGLEDNTDIMGDDERLYVTAPDSDETLVISMLDGRIVDRRSAVRYDRRVDHKGAAYALWQDELPQPELSGMNANQDDPLWRRAFPIGSKVWLADDGKAAVFSPDGSFVVIGLDDGKDLFDTRLDAAPQVETVIVRRSRKRFVVLVGTPSVSEDPIFGTPAYGSVPFSGRVYGLDRNTGELQWKAEVADQMLHVGQPDELPALSFINQYRQRVGRSSRTNFRVTCIDVRTGKLLYDEETTGYGNLLQINAAPEKGELQVLSRQSTVTLKFSEK